jgi:hypothetical protein
MSCGCMPSCSTTTTGPPGRPSTTAGAGSLRFIRRFWPASGCMRCGAASAAAARSSTWWGTRSTSCGWRRATRRTTPRSAVSARSSRSSSSICTRTSSASRSKPAWRGWSMRGWTAPACWPTTAATRRGAPPPSAGRSRSFPPNSPALSKRPACPTPTTTATATNPAACPPNWPTSAPGGRSWPKSSSGWPRPTPSARRKASRPPRRFPSTTPIPRCFPTRRGASPRTTRRWSPPKGTADSSSTPT